MRQVLAHELGRDWKSRFSEFDFEPLAAASIGQVHAAQSRDGRDLALKLQYPGVERSIDGDVDNLALLLKALRLVPAGLDLDAVLPELKEELRREADYAREARSQEQYRAFVGEDPGVLVPRVHADLSTRRVLASDRVRALPIEDLRSPEHPQRLRDAIGEKLLRLVFRELFEFRFVQTDPNFGNYLYEPKHERVALLDFGAVRSFSRHFTDHYRDLIAATISGDSGELEERGTELGLLRGDETAEARSAFAHLCARVAEPLACSGAYDFGALAPGARGARPRPRRLHQARPARAADRADLPAPQARRQLPPARAHRRARRLRPRVPRVRRVSERCPWAGKDPLYLPYHDERMGRALARRPPPVRDADPRGRAGGAVVAHHPAASARATAAPSTASIPPAWRATPRSDRRGCSRTPASCATG